LYFNGCGLREARTAEMDLSNAWWVKLIVTISDD
jgi:hypothetical protein